MENNNTRTQLRISFAAIDPYIETNIVAPTEKPVLGKDRVDWGDQNRYPDYLLELAKTSPTLRSIINGTVEDQGISVNSFLSEIGKQLSGESKQMFAGVNF